MIKRISIAVGDEVRERASGLVGCVVRLYWEQSLFADVNFGGGRAATGSFNVCSLVKLSGRPCMEHEVFGEDLDD